MSSRYDVLLNKLRLRDAPAGLDDRVGALEDKNVKFEYWAEISSGLTGTIVPPTGSSFVLDEYPGDADAVVSTVDTGNVPDGELAYTAGGTAVTATLDAGGNYVLSAAPASYPVAIVYVAKSPLTSFDYTKEYIGKPLVVAASSGGGKWSDLETRALSGNIAELFDPVDNAVMLDFDDVLLSGASIIRVALSLDAGVSYPATHTYTLQYTRSGIVQHAGFNGVSQTSFDLVANTGNLLINGRVILKGITSAGQVSMSDLKIESPAAAQVYQYNGNGRLFTNGIVNKIKVFTSTGVNLVSGNITLSKRNF